MAPERRGFLARAAELDDLHDLDLRLFARWRTRLRDGRYTREGLRRAFARCASPGTDGYDALDVLVAGLLDVGPPEPPCRVLEPEMVPYQPVPARVVLAFVEAAGIGATDVVYDLGAGLGRVAILVALLGGAVTRGIEIEPTYVDYATRSAAALGLASTTFAVGDARHVAPEGGDASFFLYTPFRGAMLIEVLGRLRGHVRWIGSYGPCSDDIARASWLEGTPAAHGLTLFRTRG